jgi:hypothetical protein
VRQIVFFVVLAKEFFLSSQKSMKSSFRDICVSGLRSLGGDERKSTQVITERRLDLDRRLEEGGACVTRKARNR